LQFDGEPCWVSIRGPKKKDNKERAENNHEEEYAEQIVKETFNIHNLKPRIDINSQITRRLLSELEDKNINVSILIFVMFLLWVS
jgi:hypothetical protein